VAQIKSFIALIIIMAVLSGLTFPVSASAEPNVADWLQEDGAEPQRAPDTVEAVAVQEEQSLFGIIIKLVFYTLLILVMIYGLIKFLAIRQQKFQPNQAVKLMGGTPLGNNKSLQLVKVGNQVLLIGVGDQVTLIKEFTNAEEIGIDTLPPEKAAPGFTNSLSKLPQWKKAFGEARGSKTGQFEELFNESLEKQKLKQQGLKQKLSNKPAGKEGNPK
jgi:flagellar protein FliO/FliZ